MALQFLIQSTIICKTHKHCMYLCSYSFCYIFFLLYLQDFSFHCLSSWGISVIQSLRIWLLMTNFFISPSPKNVFTFSSYLKKKNVFSLSIEFVVNNSFFFWPLKNLTLFPSRLHDFIREIHYRYTIDNVLYICVFSPHLEVFNHYLFKYLFSLTFFFHTVALMY